jgi:hypothetical protein
MYLKACKSGYNKDTCPPIFVATLLKPTLLKPSYGNSPDALKPTNGFLKSNQHL